MKNELLIIEFTSFDGVCSIIGQDYVDAFKEILAPENTFKRLSISLSLLGKPLSILDQEYNENLRAFAIQLLNSMHEQFEDRINLVVKGILYDGIVEDILKLSMNVIVVTNKTYHNRSFEILKEQSAVVKNIKFI